MTLLDFAKGPALWAAISVFIIGVLWRLVGIALLHYHTDLSAPRHRLYLTGLRLPLTRSWPRKEFVGATGVFEAIGYTFHICWFVPLFFFLPHLLFFDDIVKGLIGFDLTDLTGFGWPFLSAALIGLFSAISIGCLLLVLAHRLINPVKRRLSNFDDFFSWFITIAPLLTGVAATAHVGARYETLLAVHVLSIDLLLLWFPFGKLIHAITLMGIRGITGALLERKGATL